MAHYAFLNKENLIVEVIVGIDENQKIENLLPENWYANFKGLTCKRTSYNGTIRGNFAGIGFSYFPDLDIFMPPKCHEEAVLNKDTAKWDCNNSDHDIKLIEKP
jgi:hypothetical protein